MQKKEVELEVPQQIINDLEKSYTEIEEKHAEFREVFDSDNDDDKDVITTIEDEMDGMYEEFCSAREVMIKRNKKETVRKG